MLNFVISILLGIGFFYLQKYDIIKPCTLEKFSEVSLNVSGILLGFLMALKGILISMNESTAIRILKEAGQYKNISVLLRRTIWTALVVLVFCLLYLIANPNVENELLGFVIFSVLVSAVSLMILFTYSFLKIFVKILDFEDGN